MSALDIRRQVLQSHGADSEIAEELLAYNQNVFKLPSAASPLEFPLPDEPSVSTWVVYAQQALPGGVFDFLKHRLVQLNFPIQEGISQSDGYVAVTRRGASSKTVPEATGLYLRKPDSLQLIIHQTDAGKIPILIASEREDFVSLVRALTARNEPEAIPDSMGACIISGYNNWDRVREYRCAWSRELGSEATEESWQSEFQNLIPRKELYQDRFILLSCGFYSSVAPEMLGLTSEEWRKNSFVIRREHECTHYFTRRIFQSMRNYVLDELIADYAGLIAATGRFRAEWFHHFMGLEQFPDFRCSGRLSYYRGEPPLSDGSFRILQRLLVAAAETLEQFSNQLASMPFSAANPLILLALSTLTLEELAAPGARRVLFKLLEDSVVRERQSKACTN